LADPKVQQWIRLLKSEVLKEGDILGLQIGIEDISLLDSEELSLLFITGAHTLMYHYQLGG